MKVDMDVDEWNRLLAVLSQAPWAVANPLIMKIGEQLRAQGPQQGGEAQPSARGNSAHHRTDAG